MPDTVTAADASPVPRVRVRDLRKVYPRGGGFGRRTATVAVDAVSFEIGRGRVLALVGESGSGKTTTAWLVARLLAPTAGTIEVNGRPAPSFRHRAELLAYRRQVQMVFQDPFASLNPVHDVRHHLMRPMRDLRGLPAAAAAQEAERLLVTVGLEPAAEFLTKLPHQLSGGQRQRVVIARALAVGPSVLVADEPTSMLDVSIRMGVLNLLKDLVAEAQLALLFITHDLASARYMADDIAVMYAGRIVEVGPAASLVEAPQHPYTQLLLSSVFTPERRGELRRVTGGAVVAGRERTAVPRGGCAYAPRCPAAFARCREEAPPPFPSGATYARCWLFEAQTPPAAVRPDDPAGPS